MPELPEVEVVRRGLEQWVAARTVAAVEVHHPRAVRRHLEGAEHFVGRQTFTALASEPAQTALFDAANPIPHTRLGQTADLVLIAPCTARVIGAYAAGLSTDLLTNVLLATRAPVLICPAMHTEMWEHPAVVENMQTLRRRGSSAVSV